MCTYKVPADSRIAPGDCKKLDEAGRLREYARAIRLKGETCHLARTVNTQRDLAYRRRAADTGSVPKTRARAKADGKGVADMTRDKLVEVLVSNGGPKPPKSWSKARIRREMNKVLS